MKFLTKIFIIMFLFINYSHAEIQDCSKFKRLSKDYLKCNKNNLKYKSDKSGVTEKIMNFKSSKTLTEFFKKAKEE